MSSSSLKIKLPGALLREAEVAAAQVRIPLSQFVAELLESSLASRRLRFISPIPPERYSRQRGAQVLRKMR